LFEAYSITYDLRTGVGRLHSLRAESGVIAPHFTKTVGRKLWGKSFLLVLKSSEINFLFPVEKYVNTSMLLHIHELKMIL
jgi:hypothetical protein